MCAIKDKIEDDKRFADKELEASEPKDWKCYCGKPPRTPNSILCQECDYQSRWGLNLSNTK
jgi:hypothetical protein